MSNISVGLNLLVGLSVHPAECFELIIADVALVNLNLSRPFSRERHAERGKHQCTAFLAPMIKRNDVIRKCHA